MQLLYKHNGFTAYTVNIINSFNIGRRFVVIVDGFKFYRFHNFNVTITLCSKNDLIIHFLFVISDFWRNTIVNVNKQKAISPYGTKMGALF